MKLNMSFSYGTCEFHDSDIDSNEFEWKGCWTCQHFTYDEDFHYIGARARNRSRAINNYIAS